MDKRDQEPIRKDQRSPRDVRDELSEEIQPSAVKPHVKKPNRDVARGDRDRTGAHYDERPGRSEE